MPGPRTTAAAIGGLTLLERAINYTLGSLHLVTPDALAHPTPCREWDLRTLLGHLDDSFLALTEAIDGGRVDLDGRADGPDPSADPVASARGRAGRLLGATATARHLGTISIGDRPLTCGILTSTGAIEVAVHGWDVARACGAAHPIPPSLADELLDLSPLLVTDADRPARFASPVEVPAGAGPADRLVAFLGRSPRLTGLA
jgi:uncharacterized protein (TIGR03086 family)